MMLLEKTMALFQLLQKSHDDSVSTLSFLSLVSVIMFVLPKIIPSTGVAAGILYAFTSVFTLLAIVQIQPIRKVTNNIWDCLWEPWKKVPISVHRNIVAAYLSLLASIFMGRYFSTYHKSKYGK